MMQGIKNTTNETFRRLLGNGMHYEIPKYQRDYSWDIEQWNDLWYDIQQMINDEDSHYMGYLVLQTGDDKNYQVIDGQQRLTTICILILTIVKNIMLLPGSDEEKKNNQVRADAIRSTFIGNMDMLTLTSTNKLVLNRNNNTFYKNFLSSLQEMPKRGLNASEKLMKTAFETFSSYVKTQYKNVEQLVDLVEKIADQLFFTVITVTDELNAFKVFETLNARGVQLSSSDLLKNYLFSVANSKELHETQLKELEDEWVKISDILKDVQVSDFLRIYWNSTHKTIRKNQLYRTIREEIKTPEQSFELLRNLMDKANTYIALRDPEDELWRGNQDIHDNLELLKLFNVTQPFPLLLTAYSELSLPKFSSLLGKIVVITFRYNIICGKNPNEQEVFYNKLALQILKDKSFDINELKTGIYVPNAEFEQTFAYKEFINYSRNNQIAKYVLSKIEKFTTGADIDKSQSTLEHILPESPDEDVWNWEDIKVQQYHYRLGNMTLLEYGKNKDIGNANFSEKKQVYATSTVPMTKEIGESDISEWTEAEIDNRQKKMAEKAKGIWKL